LDALPQWLHAVPLNLNPMTGQRTDLDVTKEDGAKAEQCHATWRATRKAYLERLAEQCSADAAEIYRRELRAMDEADGAMLRAKPPR